VVSVFYKDKQPPSQLLALCDYAKDGVSDYDFHKYLKKARHAQSHAMQRSRLTGIRVDHIVRHVAALLYTKHECYWCHKSLLKLEDKTIDHLIPIDRGGGHVIGNVIVACGDCNHKKDNMTKQEFSRYLRDLKKEGQPLVNAPKKHEQKRQQTSSYYAPNYNHRAEEARVEQRIQELWGKGKVNL
jgi:5-methylcytosine-specific restriction endonuclease McrA